MSTSAAHWSGAGDPTQAFGPGAVVGPDAASVPDTAPGPDTVCDGSDAASRAGAGATGEALAGAPAADPPPLVGGAGLRASDGEREAAIGRLHTALGEGRLDLEETEQRVAAVYAARYRWQLAAVSADLPDLEPGQPTGWALVWQVLLAQLWRSWCRLIGAPPDEPSRRQRRGTSIAVLVAAVWMIGCLLVGLAVGAG